jgi:arabinan endo-1,5-alpha-L-arabinosidase
MQKLKYYRNHNIMRSIFKNTNNTLLKSAGILLVPGIVSLSGLMMTQTSCTDIEGEGNDSIMWEGVSLPQESSYWNPVWEPDLSNPSVFRGATQFYAFGDEKEWSSGLKYTVPVLRSGNLMSWSLTGEAFPTKPVWAGGDITSVSALFAKTLSTYYLAYTLSDGIGIAYSKAPQGPYIDYGEILNPNSLGIDFCREPVFIQAGLKFYIFFESGDGIYGAEMNVVKNSSPTLKGSIFRIAGTGFKGVHIYRKASDDYYFFATSGEGNNTSIKMARATAVNGPYLDKDGNDVLNGNGTELLIAKPGNDIVTPSQIGGIFSDYQGDDWILYQVTDATKPVLSTGQDRHPMMLNKIIWDSEGWPTAVIEASKGWQKPKFILSI